MANDKTQAANWAIARAKWEGEPRCSYADLADFLEVSKQAIGKRALKDGWSKKLNMGNIVDKAHAVADRKIAREAAVPSKRKGKVDDFLDPGAWVPSDAAAGAAARESKDATPEMLAQAVEDAAVDARAKILTRHRVEWPAARNQIYKALKPTTDLIAAMNLAKLAKLAAETLKLVQDGERKAWGLDAGDTPPGQMRIIVERTEGVRVV